MSPVESNKADQPAPAEVGSVGTAEDLARADLYGLIANLFFQPPDRILLDRMLASGNSEPIRGDAPLADFWLDLLQIIKESTPEQWRNEYESSFIGVGKPNVFLYASYYMAGHLHEKPLLNIRKALADLGLEAAENTAETEDHFAALCEVMRFLIAGDDVEVSNLTNQRVFFDDHIRPWYDEFCDAIEADPDTHLYKAVAALTREFLAIEAQGFDML